MDISTIRGRLDLRENRGKIIAIDIKHPFDTLMQDGEVAVDENDGRSTFGTAVIYNAVSNLVKADMLIKKATIDQIYYIFWDGTNRHHRRVARGAYLISIKYAIDKKSGEENRKFSVRWC